MLSISSTPLVMSTWEQRQQQNKNHIKILLDILKKVPGENMRIIKQNIIKYSIKINSSWEQHPLRHVLHRIWVFSHPRRKSGDDEQNCDEYFDYFGNGDIIM